MATYGALRTEDFPELEEILYKTWGSRDLKDYPGLAEHYGGLLLMYYALRNTYTCVARQDGKAVGLLVASRKGESRMDPKYLEGFIRELIMLLLNERSRENELRWLGFCDASKALEAELDQPYDAELELFVVDSKYRHQGIGKAMFSRMLDYFQETGVRNFYLHTDTACDYGFYEARGMRKIVEKQTDISCADFDHLGMFIFGDDVASQQAFDHTDASRDELARLLKYVFK